MCRDSPRTNYYTSTQPSPEHKQAFKHTLSQPQTLTAAIVW